MADGLDLNLLRVFDALMQTGSVTGAAERLRLSTPATSRALARLRRSMGDEIMVRAGRGLVPTPFAQGAAGKVRRLIEDAAQLGVDGQGSDPASWQRMFTVRINDSLVPVLTPAVLASTRAEAPGISVRFVAEGTENSEALRDGTIDIDVGAGGHDAPDIHAQDICRDRYVAVVAAASRLGRADGLTIDDLCALPHISASRRGRFRGPIDEALHALGRHRRVAAAVPSMTAAAALALEDDVIVPLPGLLARHLVSKGMPLRWHALPVLVPPVDISLRWHQRLDADRPTAWLRDRIRRAVPTDPPEE
ncbi:LysR family transcriptional regulator [Streptomyces sp. ISL-12]|uniref:LysR family transcriptional regulator n=1 Tax=Streptomyces sp. ISL-12 TaxID=2819177 RepID=UPI001BECB006|nr:LysR family transcriptional regulator [Streptomyces sp. ISL-12]MBT2415532.1 LysR family transcriptional regulator [Streptomyces sp. ISL-12]